MYSCLILVLEPNLHHMEPANVHVPVNESTQRKTKSMVVLEKPPLNVSFSHLLTVYADYTELGETVILFVKMDFSQNSSVYFSQGLLHSQ